MILRITNQDSGVQHKNRVTQYLKMAKAHPNLSFKPLLVLLV